MASQLPLFPNLTHQFPSTRYQGSKSKLVNWIWEQCQNLAFDTCLDAFGGTGSVAYKFKENQKSVTYNDRLTFNYHFGHAFIENFSVTLTNDDLDWILSRHDRINYPQFVSDTFHDVYFTDEENKWIDQTITNIRQLDDPFKYSLAFFALAQACIIKRPYNLFHRKNLYIRTANVKRSFGNKTTWDTPFAEWFCHFVDEANQAVFNNQKSNIALNQDVLEIQNTYDLIYIDTPYISKTGTATDYRDFYHFLEGLTLYDDWQTYIDRQSKHLRLKRKPSQWNNKNHIHQAFDNLFQHFSESILVVSYRSDGIPSQSELIDLLKKYKSHVEVIPYGTYQYALSKNKKSQEILLVGTS